MYYRYADAPADITYDDDVYTACYCVGQKIQQGSTVLKNQTVVKTDWQNPFAWLYTIQAPEGVVHYTRYRGYGEHVKPNFMGDVIQVIFKQDGREGNRWCEITIDPISAEVARAGTIPHYSRQCNVDLYSDLCGVDRDDYDTSGTIDSMDGTELTSTTFGTQSDGWWTGGDILVAGYRRAIVDHTGNVVTISPAIPVDVTGNAFTAWPGCDHLCDTCDAKFDNKNNFRGQPDIPDKNVWSQWGVT